ncbi:MAG: V-type ATPase subunit [Promethearchaeota archaeon]|nr:MAG: V-type ATPase subunit [Candidatus Lokiarchaeota archaeon]
MKSNRYNSIMPRVALENLKLIEFDDLVYLIGKSLEEIFSFLANTPYREEIVNTCGPKVEPGLLEEALLQNYARIFNKLMESSSDYIKRFLLSTLDKFNALNLKTLFRMVHAKINPEDILPHIVPLGLYNRQKCEDILTKFNSVSEIINSIEDKDFGYTLKVILTTKNILHDLTPLEAALDREAFTRMLKVIKNLNRKDKKIAKNIIGIEIDAWNVIIILKYKSMINNYENIEEKLMPTSLINKETLLSVINDTNLKSALQHLVTAVETQHEVYLNCFTKLVEESNSPMSRLEFILERAPLEMSFFEMKKNFRYYNIGFILSFLYLKWAEIKNLISIVNATARKVGEEQIRDSLILPYSLISQ